MLPKAYQLYYTGQLDESVEILDRIIEDATDDILDEVELLKAKCLTLTGKYKESLDLLYGIIIRSEKNINYVSKIKSLIAIGDNYWRMGEFNKLIPICEQGEQDLFLIQDIEESINSNLYVRLKHLKGIHTRYTGELDLAIEYFSECFAESEKHGDIRMIGNLYSALGVIYSDTGNYQLALEHINQSIKIKKVNGFLDELGISYFNKGTIFVLQGKLNQALETFTRSQELSTKFQDKRLDGLILEEMGLIYERFEDYQTAFDYLNESFKIKNELGNTFDITKTIFNLIRILLNTDRMDLAQQYYDNFLPIFQSNLGNEMINLRKRLIDATFQKNSDRIYDQALAQIEFKDIIHDKIIDYELTRYALLNLTDLLLIELRITGEEEVLNELLNIINHLHSISIEEESHSINLELLLLKSKISELQLDFDQAQSYLEDALQLAIKTGLRQFETKISTAYDALLTNLDSWKQDQDKSDILSRIERSEFQFLVADLINKKVEPLTQDDKPLIFLILSPIGEILMSKQFGDGTKLDDFLLSSFLTAINLFVGEAFSDEHNPQNIERLKHGNANILIRSFDKYRIVYIHEGSSIMSVTERFDNFCGDFNTLYGDICDDRSKMTPECMIEVDELIDKIFVKKDV
jgi:tetratricopeptide (TPR) repeat protein